MSRRAGPLASLLALAAVASGLLLGFDASGDVAGPAPRSRTSVLLVLRTEEGPLVAVVAAGGAERPGGITIAPGVALTVPGQGEGRVSEAALLPGRPAATAISNLVGAWIPHHAILDERRLGALVDRAGGLEVFGDRLDGSGVVGSLGAAGRLATWREVVRALLAAAPTWSVADFAEVDDPATVQLVLSAAAGAEVVTLPTSRLAEGLSVVDDEEAAELVGRLLGSSGLAPTPVVVLNGSGEPGVGEAVAERLIPEGFRIVVSENASSFDHRRTLVVASSDADRPAAERAQSALGVGTVSVAGATSGLGAVTIVVGKDFEP